MDVIPTIPNSKLANATISIAGHSTALGGSVSLNTGDISEHTDYPYFTNARARGAVSVSGDLAYNSSTGIISFTERTDAEVRGLFSAGGSLSYNSTTGVMSFTMPEQNTSNITEGTNLYFTNARARSAISATGSLSYNSTTGVMSFTMPAQNTSNITEGTNLYYTNARADARIAAASTSDLSEGTNLYYTDARADARVALIVDSAPGTLNTLNELAAALGDDANFSTTVTNSIATKLPLAGGALTGAVTTNSTFDGRNVSVDGAKLDGIEAGATADQTAAQILTAIKTVDGSGSGLDADLLDGIDSGSFLRSDADDAFTGNLTTGADNYITFGPNTTWGSSLRIGGNGRTATGTEMASIATTDGNIHLDAANSVNGIYLNYYAGTNGTYFGNGASGIVAKMFADGQLYKSDTNVNPYWNSTNDGSGSGLDADLLDGQEGSYYAPVSSSTAGVAHGYLALGQLTSAMDTTNLDLDIVGNASIRDGYLHFGISSNSYSSWKTRIGSANSSTMYIHAQGININNTGYASPAVNWLTANASEFSHKGNTIWHAGNDGSGSGLDADLLDGNQASAFYTKDVETISTTSLVLEEDWASGTYNGQFVIQGSYPSWETRGTSAQPYGWLHHQDNSGNYTLYSIAGYTGTSWTQRFTFNHADQTFRNGGPSGNVYYHQGNVGPGSGLDADLLDGQQGSYYFSSANYPDRTNFENVYNNLSTSTGASADLNTVFQNSRSGFIDGWSGSNFPSGTSHVQGIQARHQTGAHYGFQLVNQYDQQQMWHRQISNSSFGAWNRIWSSSTDGSGSGLDADLLDGKQLGEIAAYQSGSDFPQGTLVTTNIISS